MMLNQITEQAGARRRRKRVGRGESSGHGRTSGRGNKGAQSRAGYSGRVLSEGGQAPIFRRLPKRGFNNYNFRREYQVVNLDQLQHWFKDGGAVAPAELHAHGLISDAQGMVKVLGDGSLTRKLSVTAHAFSVSARAAIEKAGGSVALLPQRDPAALAKAKRRSAKGRKRAAVAPRLEKKKAARGTKS